jgi:hypothetical protein
LKGVVAAYRLLLAVDHAAVWRYLSPGYLTALRQLHLRLAGWPRGRQELATP